MQGFSSNPANRFAEYPNGGHGTEIFRVHADLEPAIAGWFAEHLIAHPHAKQGSAILSSLVGCNALVELPADATEILPNKIVPAILLDAV